jgi:hypothetical protein
MPRVDPRTDLTLPALEFLINGTSWAKRIFLGVFSTFSVSSSPLKNL